MTSHEALHVVAIPYAGSDRFAYRALQNYAPKTWIWSVLDLPGRGPRRKEVRLNAVAPMVDDLYSQLQGIADNRPYFIMGHSMGAILAYELMCRCHHEGFYLPDGAMLSSIAAPGIARSHFISHLGKVDFWNAIRMYNGVPDGILANDELRDYFEPVLRDDFAAIERYKPLGIGPKQLPVKLMIRAGKSEKIEETALLAWQDVTIYPIDINLRTGDHFYLLKDATSTIADLTALSKNI